MAMTSRSCDRIPAAKWAACSSARESAVAGDDRRASCASRRSAISVVGDGGILVSAPSRAPPRSTISVVGGGVDCGSTSTGAKTSTEGAIATGVRAGRTRGDGFTIGHCARGRAFVELSASVDGGNRTGSGILSGTLLCKGTAAVAETGTCVPVATVDERLSTG